MSWWQFRITGGIGDVVIVALSIRFVVLPAAEKFVGERIERHAPLEHRLRRAW